MFLTATVLLLLAGIASVTSAASAVPGIEWVKVYDPEGMFDEARAVVESGDGGYVLAGTTTGKESSLANDLLLLKVDGNGNVLKVKKWTPEEGYRTYGYDMIKTSTGYVITGATMSNNMTVWTPFLLEVDADLNEVWHKVYEADVLGESGGEAYSVRSTGDGYLVCGIIRNESDTAGLVLTTDTRGELLGTQVLAVVPDTVVQGGVETDDGRYAVVAGGNGLSVAGTIYVNSYVSNNEAAVYSLNKSDPLLGYSDATISIWKDRAFVSISAEGGKIIGTMPVMDPTVTGGKHFGDFSRLQYWTSPADPASYPSDIERVRGGLAYAGTYEYTDRYLDENYNTQVRGTYTYAEAGSKYVGFYNSGTNTFDYSADVAGVRNWDRYYGAGNESASSIVPLAEGYVLAGTSRSQTDHDELYLALINQTGTLIWDQNYTVAGRNVEAFSVLPAPDGGYLIAGKVRPYGASLQDDESAVLIKIGGGSALATGRETAGLINGSATVTAAPTPGVTAPGPAVLQRPLRTIERIVELPKPAPANQSDNQTPGDSGNGTVSLEKVTIEAQTTLPDMPDRRITGITTPTPDPATVTGTPLSEPSVSPKPGTGTEPLPAGGAGSFLLVFLGVALAAICTGARRQEK